VGLVLLCLLQEGISRTRTAVARQYGATTSQSVDVADTERSPLVEAATPSLGRYAAVTSACHLGLSDIIITPM